MRIVSVPIRVLVDMDEKGHIRPLRFRSDESETTICVDRVLEQDERRLGGSRQKIFRCQSHFEDHVKTYELHYTPETLSWVLYALEG